jgi:hypothetical protein
MKQVFLQDNFITPLENTEIYQKEATQEIRDITAQIEQQTPENSVGHVKESFDSVPEEEEELEEIALRELLTAKMLPTQTKKTDCPDQFNSIHSISSITNLQLAVAVFGFICKNCSEKKGPIKDLLKLLQLCLPVENNFAKTYSDFSKVMHEFTLNIYIIALNSLNIQSILLASSSTQHDMNIVLMPSV